MDRNKDLARAALTLLSRVQIAGTEADAFIEVRNFLSAIINGSSVVVPADESPPERSLKSVVQ
jgi:hypothetical protein